MIEIKKQDLKNGKQYDDLIEYCLRTCDYFMFVICNFDFTDDYNVKMEKIKSKLSDLFVKERSNPIWPSTESLDDRHKYNICFYKCDAKALELLKAPGGVFEWRYPDYPEDLSFFRGNQCFMYLSAHEEELWFQNETDKDVDFFKNIGICPQNVERTDDSCFEPFYEDGLT